MDNPTLSDPLLNQEQDYSKLINLPNQMTTLPSQVYQENKTDPELLSLKQAIIDISTQFDKKLPRSFNLPFTVQEIVPLLDGIHYLASTKEGTVLYLNPSAQTFDDKKISADAFSLVFIEGESIAYFSRANEILTIKIPSLELNKFWSFEEGKHIISFTKNVDQKSLLVHFSDEIILFHLSNPNKTKSLFTGDFLNFSISSKGQIALISSNSQLIALSSDNEKVSKTSIDIESLKLEYSPKGSMIIIGYESQILIFKASNLEKIQKINVTQNKLGISTITNDENFIIFPDKENLQFYDLKSFEIRETINIDDFPILFIGLNINNNHIYVSGSNSKFYTLLYPVFDSYKAIEVERADPLDESTVLFRNGEHFQTWNFMTDEITDVVTMKVDYFDVQNNKNFFVQSGETMSKVHIPTRSISTVFLDKNLYEPMYDLCFSPDGKFVVTGSAKRLFLWDLESMTIIKEFKGHDSMTRNLSYLSKSNALAGIAENCTPRIWDLDTTKEIAILYENDETYSMNVTHNEEIIIVITMNGSINFWDWRKNIKLHSLKSSTPAIERVIITKDDKFMIGYSSDGRVLFISLETFNQLFSYKYETLYNMKACGDGDYIFFRAMIIKEHFGEVTKKCMAVVRENPLKMSKITCAGPGNKYEYMKYISKLLKNQEVEYNPDMDNWTIFPYRINTFHLYAYFNHPNHLKLALKNGSSMINTVLNQNPLSIAIRKGYSNCVSTIIFTLDKYLPIHPYSLKSLSNDTLVKLNSSNCSSLLKFYDAIFRKDTSEHAAKFCSSSAEIPIHFWSENIFIENSNFLNSKALKEQERPITFLSSYVMLDLTVGSQASIDFLFSIYDSPNPNIMMTPIIQEIIRYKWDKLSWVMHAQAIIYFVYMLILSMYVLYFIEEKTVLSILFAISMLLSVYEAYQLWASPISYAKDLWNYIDIARTVSSILYFAISLSPQDWEINHKVLVFLVIISWLRGISYFRILQNTRYMVNLITEVLKDMTSFLILLFYSTLSFAFIFFVLDENSPKFWNYLKMSYLFDVGDFDTSGMNTIQWVCFILVTLINMIVMLNLLIAIIGNSFGKVQENYQIADTHELVGMIIEIETMLVKNRKVSDPRYFQMCIDSNSNDNKDETDRTIPLKKHIKTLQVEIAKVNEEVNSVKADSAIIKKYLEKLIEIKATSDEQKPNN